jgi:DNA-binding NarL/FixJ family response regulator
MWLGKYAGTRRVFFRDGENKLQFVARHRDHGHDTRLRIYMQRRPRIKVLLVDDHHIVREGIRSSLTDEDAISIVGEAANGKIALQKIKDLAPDVVLMDLNMPVMDGLEATRQINKIFPKTKVLALTVHDSEEYVSRILHNGARGYVLKNTSPEQLIVAIKSVAEGDAFFSPSVSHLLLNEFTKKKKEPLLLITPRERDVLAFLASGDTNKEVAGRLNLSVRTVETHRAKLMKKLNARNAAELSRIALERNLV